MKTVLLIRHGATAGNLERRYIGRTDEPLCETGVAQITALREKHLSAERIFVSPMLRTRQTAELLFPGIPQTVVDDLRETDFGIFEGKTAAELVGNADYRTWLDSWCQGTIPDGESKDAMTERCCVAFRLAMEQVAEGELAAFVVHGGVIMALLERLGPAGGSFYDYHVKNGGYVRCAWEGGILRILEKG